MNSFGQFLADKTVREVHAQPRRRWLPITAEHGAYQADLLFLDAYAHQNRGYAGILTVVEIGNRYAYAIPIKGKDDTYRAFNVFLDEAKKIGHAVYSGIVDDRGRPRFVDLVALDACFEDMLETHGIEVLRRLKAIAMGADEHKVRSRAFDAFHTRQVCAAIARQMREVKQA